MAAITGQWRPPTKGIQQWAVDWMRNGVKRWSSNRKWLAEQLLYIRKHHGVHEAIEFRNYLLWIGCGPTGYCRNRKLYTKGK